MVVFFGLDAIAAGYIVLYVQYLYLYNTLKECCRKRCSHGMCLHYIKVTYTSGSGTGKQTQAFKAGDFFCGIAVFESAMKGSS